MLDAERAGLEHELLSFIPTGLGVFDVTGEIVEMRYLNDGYYQMIGSSRAMAGAVWWPPCTTGCL